MRQTGNYQLNQWEKEDRIQMEDFNTDNERIDAAVKAVDGRVTETGEALARSAEALNAAVAGKRSFSLLRDLTTGLEVGRLSFSTQGLALADYQMLVLDIDLLGTGTFFLRPNGSASAAYYSGSGDSTNGSMACVYANSHHSIVLFPLGRGAARITCLTFGNGPVLSGGATVDELNYAALTSLDFVPQYEENNRITGGSRLALWGVR